MRKSVDVNADIPADHLNLVQHDLSGIVIHAVVNATKKNMQQNALQVERFGAEISVDANVNQELSADVKGLTKL